MTMGKEGCWFQGLFRVTPTMFDGIWEGSNLLMPATGSLLGSRTMQNLLEGIRG